MPLLVDAADEEHLVVHREAEQDREHHHRQERLDRPGPVDADQAAPPAPLEDGGDDAERGARRTAGSSPPPSRGISRLRKTAISSRNDSSTTTPMNSGSLSASTVEKSSKIAVWPPTSTFDAAAAGRAGHDVVAQAIDAGRWSTRPAATASGRRRRWPRRRCLPAGDHAAGVTPTTPSVVCRPRATTLRERRLGRPAVGTCATSCSGPLKPGPKPFGQQVVGLAGRGARRVVALVGGAQPHREERDRDQQHQRRRGERRTAPGGAAARPAQRAQPGDSSVSDEPARSASRARGLRPSTRRPEEAEQRRQQRQRGEHGERRRRSRAAIATP